MSSESIDDLAKEWLRLDQNESTRNEIQSLLQVRNTDELEKRLRIRIEFGTAGLRGRMEAGFSRMNDLVIIQASQGLCAYLLEMIPDASERGVVIGHDHRYHSEHWAQLTAAAFVTSNVKVHLLRGVVHTPMVPFGVKHVKAACGVMITASHNPKQDNGYKVYWENAVQIIEPHDKGIAASILRNLEPQTWNTGEALLKSPLLDDPTKELHVAYFASLSKLCHSRFRSLNTTVDVKFVNTSMHGVSHNVVEKAFEAFGFPPFVPVKEQQQPDPEFPTVKFPNPEEHGALDLALSTAAEVGATYVLAQDPDGDRFSAAEKGSDGRWTTFTGDQLGSVFASRVLELYRVSGKPIDKLAMVASTVSSKMVEAMAAAEGFKFAECLTGFKFIGNTGLSLVHNGFEVPFGYEEAIGFMFGDDIRDKDGVAATMVFAELVVSLRSQGKSVNSYLQDLYAKYGFFQTRNSYFICRDPPTIDRIFAQLRSRCESVSRVYPRSISGLTITTVRDLTVGYDSSNPPKFKPLLPLSSGHMIQFRAESPVDSTKIFLTIRTSGTEPKIKYYLEGSGSDMSKVDNVLAGVVAELGDQWLQARLNHLESP
ncbi:hypothetical protein JAAARDRAFT_124136 [Jaapia argillacea MUCL 33604]|uniref:Phosphoglucomutase n=1 Tax=Jaapia argillacea MUCL 33604 TaxID=933084 RepID=A0A067Q328_9AGAM|nr:hypothetical protein JAAARDRAFT_124136 [Jaapia argillacea MUCL 33604]